MRVTSTMFPDALIGQLGLLSTRQLQLQNEAATGLRVQNPADDPAAMRRALDMQAQSKLITQYQTNITSLQNQAAATSSVTSSLQKITDRVNEIATLTDGTKSQQDLNAYATEVNQLIQQAAQLVNSKNAGEYLFGGTRSDVPPFVVATDSSSNVTSVTYQGNTSVNSSEIAEGLTISAQTLGANTTGSGPTGLITDSRTGADLFSHLISLQTHLLAGDTASIASTDRPQLTADENNMISQTATIAALQARLTAASSMATGRSATLTQSISNETNADIAQTMVQLSQTQTAYQAALQSGAKILSLSLLDYLR